MKSPLPTPKFFPDIPFSAKKLDARSRVQSIKDGDSDTTAFSQMKSPLPTPKFFPEISFSAKKDRTRQRSERPPPTPRFKSLDYGSISLLNRFSEGSGSRTGASNVSLKNPNKPLSKLYDPAIDRPFFHQCFDVICKVGSGSFGDVFKCISKEDGHLYAIKRTKQQYAGHSDRARKLKEVHKHEALRSHPNCVKFYNAWEENSLLYIQTELCRWSLSQYAEQNHDIPEHIIWNYLIDLLLAIKHIHDHNYVHLDVKPDNIFISAKDVCKLGDFGLILDLAQSDVSDAIEGDPRYIAPELMKGDFSKAADIFSVGITILELASDLDLPSGGEAWHDLRHLKIPAEFVKGLSNDLLKVISLMMTPDCTTRPSADDILNLETMNKLVEERKKLLDFSDSDPELETFNGNSRSPEWSSSISDDVFDRDSNGNASFLNGSHNENILGGEDVFGVRRSSKRSSAAIRSRSPRFMSTPHGLRCNRPRAHDTSGSPCLSGGKKKQSFFADDGTLSRSPKLQLFSDSSDEEEGAGNLPHKNLMSVFDSLSSE